MINNEICDKDTYSNTYYANLRLPLLNLLHFNPQKVLEIGCGSGLTLEYLKEQGSSEVVGVEIRPDIAEQIQKKGKIDRIWNIDITKDELPETVGSFDLIILSHVLEHFAEPHLVMEFLKIYAKPGAYFLIAVPNIRHLSVLIPLILKGNFDYVESGILDHTHLRFYTRSSMTRFLDSLGFELIKSEYELMGPKSKMLNIMSFGLLRPLCGYAVNFLVRL